MRRRAVAPHPLEHVEGADDVGLDVRARRDVGERDRDQRREVQHDVDALDRGGHVLGVADVAQHHLGATVGERLRRRPVTPRASRACRRSCRGRRPAPVRPAARTRSTTWLPMKPSDPVTSTVRPSRDTSPAPGPCSLRAHSCPFARARSAGVPTSIQSSLMAHAATVWSRARHCSTSHGIVLGAPSGRRLDHLGLARRRPPALISSASVGFSAIAVTWPSAPRSTTPNGTWCW